MATYLVAAAALLAICYIYRLLLPRPPLPGIPHNPASTRRLFGDMGAAKALGRQTGEMSAAIFHIARNIMQQHQPADTPYKIPIAQLLVPSFLPGTGAHVVVVDDAREAEDILVRRNREFDRSELTAQFFRPVFPRSTIAQPTTPALRAQKRLWSDVMGADFLRRVVAPNICGAAEEVVELWRIKAAAAAEAKGVDGLGEGGRPFDVKHDFGTAALDAIWVAVLGSKLGAMRREIERVRQHKACGEEAKAAPGQSGALPSSAVAVQQAVEHMNRIVTAGFGSVWPAAAFFWIQLTPAYRRFKRVAYGEVRGLMAAACARFDSDGADELDTCAMDLVLRREMLAAKKAGRPVPDPTRDPAMLQELLLLLLAVSVFPASSVFCSPANCQPTRLTPFPSHNHRATTRQPTRFPGSSRSSRSTQPHNPPSAARCTPPS